MANDPDGNLRALIRVLEDGAGDELETLADRLLASPRRPTQHGDDIALMVARADGASRPSPPRDAWPVRAAAAVPAAPGLSAAPAPKPVRSRGSSWAAHRRRSWPPR